MLSGRRNAYKSVQILGGIKQIVGLGQWVAGDLSKGWYNII